MAAKAYSGLGSHKLATAELSKAIKDNPDFVEGLGRELAVPV